jgi:hypothetical protein
MTNITVLKDENLSGAGRVVEREYREVKRKAVVGERIMIVNADYDELGATWGYDNGEVHTVVSSDGAQEVNIRPDGTENSEIYVEQDEYVTLEPTDIIRFNGARFRMVDRKAAVGERVIIIAAETATGSYRNGDVMTVKSEGRTGNGVYTEETWVYVFQREYRVLEPVETAEAAPTPEPLSAKPAPDQAAEIIAALTTRVASLERRMTALEVVNLTPIPRKSGKTGAQLARTVSELPRVKSPQEIRDDIVKRAKEDVERLVDDCLEAARVG